MNTKQKAVVIIALAAFAYSLWAAPWTVNRSAYTITETHPVWDAPINGQLNLAVLLVEWVAIGVIAGGLALLLRQKHRSRDDLNREPTPQEESRRNEEQKSDGTNRRTNIILSFACLLCVLAVIEKGCYDVHWAEAMGMSLGVTAASLMLSGFVWLVSLLTRRKLSRAQFMSCFMVAVFITMGLNIFRLSSGKPHPTLDAPAVEQNPTEPQSSASAALSTKKEVLSQEAREVVQLWRKHHPTDTRPDDQILIAVAEYYHDTLTNFPDAMKDLVRIQESNRR